jgi:hypothetical protein
MISIKPAFGLLLAAVAAGAFAGASSAEDRGPSARSGELHVTKECGEYTGQAGQFCTITSSNVKAIPVGSRIFYLQAAGPASLDSDIVLVVGPGNYALGHVTLDFATGAGEVRFSGGIKQFTSFRARVDVSALGSTNWAWDGEYRFGRGDE